jgi:hypothetical protein
MKADHLPKNKKEAQLKDRIQIEKGNNSKFKYPLAGWAAVTH